jgi:hypothetical protein
MQRRDKETRIKMPAAGEPEGVRLGAHLNIGFTNKLKLECQRYSKTLWKRLQGKQGWGSEEFGTPSRLRYPRAIHGHGRCLIGTHRHNPSGLKSGVEGYVGEKGNFCVDFNCCHLKL